MMSKLNPNMNKLNPNIILIGFMGSGKTSTGEVLAGKLGLRFQDTDLMIERKEKAAVSDIFTEKGEGYFRDMETELLLELKDKLVNTVLSAGGGLPLREENRTLLKELGLVVYLEVTAQEAVIRLNGDTTRPLLAEGNLKERVSDMLKVRSPIYEQAAHIKILTDNITPEEAADLIIREYEKRLQEYTGK